MISCEHSGSLNARHRASRSKNESREPYTEHGSEITELWIISAPFNLLDWKIPRIVGVHL